jgi:hypothetical protein
MLTQIQNAMNAAEITDKLGLHSLRQRAWVSTSFIETRHLLISTSTFNPLVLLPEMVFTKVWSGLQALSERLVISKFWRHLLSLNPIVFPERASNRTIETSILSSSPPYRSLVLHLINHSCLFQRFTSIRGARVVIVR